MPIFDPTNLVGHTFLMDPQENGERYRTKILEALVKNEEQLAKHPDRIKFICSVNEDMYEEIITYNEILEHSLTRVYVQIFKRSPSSPSER